MKRLATLFILTILVTTAGFAKPKHKDLSGNIAIKGELTKEYQQSPAGTPVIIRRVVKMNNPGENSDNIYYAVEVNGIQETIPSDEMGIIAISAPETDREFWQQIYLIIFTNISTTAVTSTNCARKSTKNAWTISIN